MSYKKHELFTDPKDTNLIWRYLDFTKFVSLISTGHLYFPCTRTLQLIDPWEGSYLKKELSSIIKNILNFLKKTNKIPYKGKTSEYDIAKIIEDDWKYTFEEQKNVNFISCWHYNSNESAAMWRLYLKSNEGLCIQTEINSFKESFNDEQKNVYIGKVLYRDYENDYFYFLDKSNNKVGPDCQNLFLPLIHKRKLYEHENEYRAIVPCYGESVKGKSGLNVKINLQTLIKKIILAPSSPDWFGELVKDTLRKYNLDFPVCKSDVDDKPYEFDLSPYEPKKD